MFYDLSKKGQSEIRVLTFLVIFITIMGIIGNLVGKVIIQKYRVDDSTVFGSVFNFILNQIDNIPIIGNIWTFFTNTITFIFIHDELKKILLALVTIPLAYILLRLIQGGG